MKFKKGDRVVITHRDSCYGGAGYVSDFQDDKEFPYIITLDVKTLSHEGLYGANDECIELEVIYNSPLYKAMK
jgi:hypothetical protein